MAMTERVRGGAAGRGGRVWCKPDTEKGIT